MKRNSIQLIIRLSSSALCLTAIIILAFPVVVLEEGCGPGFLGCVANRYSAFDLSRIGAAGIECFWIPYCLILCLPFLVCGAFLKSRAWKIVGTAFSSLLLLPAIFLQAEPDHLALETSVALSVSSVLITAFSAYVVAGAWQLAEKLISDSPHHSA